MEVNNSVTILIRGSAVAFQRITDVQKTSDKKSVESANLTKSGKKGTIKSFTPSKAKKRKVCSNTPSVENREAEALSRSFESGDLALRYCLYRSETDYLCPRTVKAVAPREERGSCASDYDRQK